MNPFLRWGLGCLLGSATLLAAGEHERTLQVGGYPYPPYVENLGSTEFDGATLDLLEQLNDWQTRIEFEFVPVAAFSRQLSFRQERFEVMFFESPNWGWSGEAVVMSEPIARDRDLYVALDKPGRDQSYFDRIRERHLIATRGYHYGFAGYRTDETWLQDHFEIDFAPSLGAILEMLKRERGEVAVLNESYLRARRNNGLDMSGLLISEQADHAYELSVVAREDAELDMDWLLEQLRQMRAAGLLEPIEHRWGIRFTDF